MKCFLKVLYMNANINLSSYECYTTIFEWAVLVHLLLS